MSYATLTDLKTHAGIPAAGADDLLQALLDSATQWIDGYTHSVFTPASVTDEKHDGRSAPHLLLRLRPVTSIASVELDGGLLDAGAYSLVDSAWLVASAPGGWCPRLGYFGDTGDGACATDGWGDTGEGACATGAGATGTGLWPRGTQNVSVSYSAGYASVPAAVSQACALLAAQWYRDDQRQGASSESYGPRSVSYGQPDAAPLAVRSLLAQFIQPEAGY